MMFGRHRGVELEQLPDDYTQWLSTIDDLREPLASALAVELRRRFGPPADPTLTLTPEAAEMAGKILGLGYRAAILGARAGDADTKAAADSAVAWLRAQLPHAAPIEHAA